MITASACTSYLSEILLGLHRPNHVYKLALYKASASLSASTQTYSAAHEVPESGSYRSGGSALQGFHADEDACLHFDDVLFTKATIDKPKGGLIYNSSVGDRAVAVLVFEEPVSSVLGNFKVELPVPLLRMRPAK